MFNEMAHGNGIKGVSRKLLFCETPKVHSQSFGACIPHGFGIKINTFPLPAQFMQALEQ